MRTREHAERVAQAVALCLQAAGVTGVTVELDAAKGQNALPGGDLLAVVNPPSVELPTWNQGEAEWSVWLISGPATDSLAAWDRLDDGLDALTTPLELDRVDPDAFTDARGVTWPAYRLTFTSSITL